MIRDDLVSRLELLDEEASLLFDDSKRFRMVIVGGSALILLEVIPRATHDIDALSVSPELFNLLEKYDIDSGVMTYVNNYPYNYEDRLNKLPFGGRIIDYYTASLEDIVLAKLHSSRPDDRQDIIDSELLKRIDWEKLEILARSENEAAASALNDRIHKDFLYDYEEYVKRYRP